MRCSWLEAPVMQRAKMTYAILLHLCGTLCMPQARHDGAVAAELACSTYFGCWLSWLFQQNTLLPAVG
jgi:hypothetical protein